VCTVDDVALILLVERGLRTELAPEELGRVGRGAAQSARHIDHVGNDGLNAIAFSLNFGGQKGHASELMSHRCMVSGRRLDLPVAVELVIDVATNVNDSSGHIVYLFSATGKPMSAQSYIPSLKPTYKARQQILIHYSLMFRYSNWRTKHESSARTEDAVGVVGSVVERYCERCCKNSR
jgi:hypothetical protein